MVEVVGMRFLHEFRDQDSEDHFPDDELSSLKTAIETIGKKSFLDAKRPTDITFDSELAQLLPNYSVDGRTEYRLWNDSKHTVDLYNSEKRIAVEIEKTERKNVWKDLWKFARASSPGGVDRIEYGCLILPENYSTTKRDHNVYKQSINVLKFTATVLPLRDIALIGYRDPRPNVSDR